MNSGKQGKKVAIIGSVGVPANYGGFETLAEYLTRELGTEHQLTVFCSSKAYSKKIATHNGARLRYTALKANGFQSIPYDIISIAKAIRSHDTLVILGVAGCFSIPFFRLFFRRKFIVNLDGSEWKRDKWGALAKWYLRTSERLAVKRADVIIADNQGIKEFIDELYETSCVLIPYGGDHVTRRDMTDKTLAVFPFLREQYAFKVCRIEPENNVHLILESCRDTHTRIVIVGNWDYSEYGRTLKAQFSQLEYIHLLDPIYDQDMLNEIRGNCSIYIHGHSAGGTNPSLVEAMTLGLTILAFDVNYNRYTTGNEAAYFSNQAELVELLRTPVTFDNGTRMEQIARSNYQWSKIARSYSELF